MATVNSAGVNSENRDLSPDVAVWISKAGVISRAFQVCYEDYVRTECRTSLLGLVHRKHLIHEAVKWGGQAPQIFACLQWRVLS
jgi:hypothetical protein